MPRNQIVPASPPQPGDPSFMAGRLDREVRARLKELGIKVPKTATREEMMSIAKGKIDGTKTERKEFKDRVATLEAEVAKSVTAIAVMKVHAEAAMTDLDDKHRAAVKAVAGDDPVKILETIALLKMSGATKAPAPVPAAVVAPPAAPPANTIPSGTAPDATNPSNEDVKATYARMKASNDPLGAAQYALTNQRALLGS